MKHKTILIICTLILSLTAYSRPAIKGTIALQQPDGSTFKAYITGDEFLKLTTTGNGHAIMQNTEGWWCYATIDDDGCRHNSGWHVGSDAPHEVLVESSRIPYEALTRVAMQRRKSAMTDENACFVRRLLSLRTKAEETVTKHGIVIPVQFKDVSLTYSVSDFCNLLTQKGYSANDASGSAKEYFDAQFGGAIEFNFDVCEPVTLTGKQADYGGNLSNGSDKAPEQMIIEACRLADESVDFSLYDDDNDGKVDNVFVFFAGGDEADGAGEDCIWSHAWYIFSGAQETLQLDGKLIDRYACTSELSRRYTSADKFTDVFTGIGTFCHEYSHTFGLPDMYDTDYEGSGGNSAGLWIWTALMDGGNQNNKGNTPPYFNAVEREILGICEPVLITGNGSFKLEPIHLNGQVYRIDTDHPDEYYLIENRSGAGWDSHIGGSGMLVYHIDKSSDRNSGYSEVYGEDMPASYRWDYTNEVNCRPDHPCADLIEADGRKDSFADMDAPEFRSLYSDIGGVFYPYAGNNSIASERFTFWSGAYGNFSITNIRKQGEHITFNITGISDLTPPKAVNIEATSYAEAAVISFDSDRIFEGEAIIEWGRTGRETETTSIKAYSPGKYAVVLEGLNAGNKTYTVNIAFVQEGMTGDPETISFMTKKKPAVEWPYIHIPQSELNEDGTFSTDAELPLILYNASDAAEIRWTFNGLPISRHGNGYYPVTKEGTLQAHIIWEDGSEECIEKEIVIGEK